MELPAVLIYEFVCACYLLFIKLNKWQIRHNASRLCYMNALCFSLRLSEDEKQPHMAGIVSRNSLTPTAGRQ